MMKNITAFLYKFCNMFVLSNGTGEVEDVTEITSVEPGFWSIIKNFGEYIGRSFLSLLESLLDLILKFAYVIIEFVLKTLDLIYIFFKELAGMNTSVNILNAGDITNSDIIFNFLLQDTVKEILLNILVFSLVLLIIFSIVAIIKTEYTAAVSDGNNSKKPILVNALRSLFVMLIVPIIAFGGIILSNTVLSSIASAFNGGADINLGTTVFMASSHQANLYREYADKNVMIPITYNLEKIDPDSLLDMPVKGSNAQLNADFKAIANASVWNTGLVTYMYFLRNQFISRDELPNYYYLTYDTNLVPSSLLPNGAPKKEGKNTTNNYVDRIDYYIMADLQDSLLKYNVPFYIIRYTKEAPFIIDYSNGTSKEMTINSTARSEETGAVFTVAIKATKVVKKGNSLSYSEDDDYTLVTARNRIYYYKYYTVDENGNEVFNESKSKFFTFNTSYLNMGSKVLAKGIMDPEGYPTTIKETLDGSIICYRDYINIPILADLFPSITYEQNDSYTQSLTSKVFNYGIETLLGVNPHDLVPYVYFRFNVWTLFQSDEKIVIQLEKNEPLTLSYFFNPIDKNSVQNFYNLKKLNWVVFILVASTLFGIIIKSAFGLISRIYDIVILFIIYPMVASCMPLDGGARAGNWNTQFISRLTSAYGIIISLNFIFLMVPIISSINLFESYMLTGAFSYMSAEFVNFAIQMAFILVLFASLKSGIAIISKFFGDSEKLPVDVSSVGESNVAAVIGKRDERTHQLKGGILGKTSDLVSGKTLKSYLIDKGLARDPSLADETHPKGRINHSNTWVPGGVIIDTIREKRYNKKRKKFMDNLYNKTIENMEDGDTAELNQKIGKLEADTKRRQQSAINTAQSLAPKEVDVSEQWQKKHAKKKKKK